MNTSKSTRRIFTRNFKKKIIKKKIPLKKKYTKMFLNKQQKKTFQKNNPLEKDDTKYAPSMFIYGKFVKTFVR